DTHLHHTNTHTHTHTHAHTHAQTHTHTLCDHTHGVTGVRERSQYDSCQQRHSSTVCYFVLPKTPSLPLPLIPSFPHTYSLSLPLSFSLFLSLTLSLSLRSGE